MPKLIIDSGEEIKEYELQEGESIVAQCEDSGVPFACTEGVCGTCVVEVIEGNDHLSPFTEEEEDFLGNEGCERLACQCRIQKGDVKIKF